MVNTNNFPYAKGVSHLFNFLKLRILEVLVKNSRIYLTSAEIASMIGVETHTVARCLSYWTTHGFKYVKKLKSVKTYKGGGWGYKYKITKYGKEAYERYMERFNKGYDLNMHHDFPKVKATGYLRINKYGKQMGLTPEDALEVAGFSK